MQAIFQSKLEQLLNQRGLTWEEFQQRLPTELIAKEELETLRDVSSADGVLSLRALSTVIAVLDCELNDLFTVIKQRDIGRLRRLAGQRFPQRKQQRLDTLLDKASEMDLTQKESIELHQLTKEYESGMIAKAEALKALKALGEDITPYVRISEIAYSSAQ